MTGPAIEDTTSLATEDKTAVAKEDKSGRAKPEKSGFLRGLKKHLRLIVQAAWGLITNGYARGFMPGNPRIYDGPLKHFCVPGMNCYSCPGALGACPIGALQASLTDRNRRFPFYVLGFLTAVGVLVGRFICGWLCLFGLIQELLYRIPTPKLKIPARLDKPLRYLKYAVLAVLVVGLPLLYRTRYGAGIPFFCEFVCPVGTLEGGVPLVLLNNALRPALGWLFVWKMVLLVLCIAASIFIYRPFCKYLCPLGAFYSLFQKFSLLRMNVDAEACTNCGACSRACAMNVDPSRKPNSAECIRCGECMKACPQKALAFTVAGRRILAGEKSPAGRSSKSGKTGKREGSST
ncbi:MAG: 4Fe-4S binding protein [Clostridia bacterium]|nr:4Fe-4S binding protein [Clostridia bacterium]